MQNAYLESGGFLTINVSKQFLLPHQSLMKRLHKLTKNYLHNKNCQDSKNI